MFPTSGDPLDELFLLSKDDIEKLQADGENVNAMSCPYKIQPENQGKLIWISGPPGAGKSTSAPLLCRHTGYVYFEADCVINHSNPYIPADVENPSMAQMFQKHIGQGITQERLDSVSAGDDFYVKLKDQELDEKLGEKFYKYMADSIGYERKRIGGDWVIAQAVPTRNLRDVIRRSLGKDLIFILLGLKKETIVERLTKRHGEGEV